MSLVLTPMKMEAWLRLNGKSSRGLLAIYGSSVLGVLLTLYWTGLVIYHIYFYSLASYLGPLLATSTPKDIYGHAAGKKQNGGGFSRLCIGSDRDPQNHRNMKQSLTAAFFNKTLKIIANVVNVFADEIGELGEPKLNGLNMTKWYAYEMLAIDILREMAF
ncbi:hypothetical protein QSH57_002850 [Fusarium oxysporum f. sp. vasinfectum]|nr:hypothetical protein QSH57_002850 [Fusarium oxysporum f. sp. vasinfectum]